MDMCVEHVCGYCCFFYTLKFLPIAEEAGAVNEQHVDESGKAYPDGEAKCEAGDDDDSGGECHGEDDEPEKELDPKQQGNGRRFVVCTCAHAFTPTCVHARVHTHTQIM